MARISLVVLTQKPEGNDLISCFQGAAEQNHVGFDAVQGKPWEEILEVASQWALLPEVIVLDVPAGMAPMDALEQLGEVLPAGEGDVIMTGVPNDIQIYRDLKASNIEEVFPDAPSSEEADAILERIVMREVRATGIDVRRATYVWSCGGGVGGTTFALAFARHFAKQGRRTLLIDMDTFIAPSCFMFAAKKNAPETTGLVDALSNPSRIDSTYLQRIIQQADKNLYYLAARRRPSDPPAMSSALPELISRAQKSFDMVVIDVPWRANPETEWMLVNGTSYLVAAPTAPSLLAFATVAKELSSAPTKAQAIGILNKAGEFKSNDVALKVFKEALSDREVLSFPYDPGAAGRLFFEQKTLLDLGGRVTKPLKAILATLPAPTMESSAAATKKPKAKKKSGGLLGRIKK